MLEFYPQRSNLILTQNTREIHPLHRKVIIDAVKVRLVTVYFTVINNILHLQAKILQRYSLHQSFFVVVVFYLGFLSRTFTIHRTARGRVSLQLFSTASTRFKGTQTLAGQLLKRALVCTQLGAGLEPGTFGVREQVANH